MTSDGESVGCNKQRLNSFCAVDTCIDFFNWLDIRELILFPSMTSYTDDVKGQRIFLKRRFLHLQTSVVVLCGLLRDRDFHLLLVITSEDFSEMRNQRS